MRQTHSPFVARIAATVMAVASAMTPAIATSAFARNTYRVEKIYRIPLEPGESCKQSWSRRAAAIDEKAGDPAKEAFPPPLLPATSFMEQDEHWCVITIFSRHFEPYCQPADTHCMPPPEDDF